MAEVSYRELSMNGLWKNNPAIVQLLGLCPLLAVTGTVVNAIGVGEAVRSPWICRTTSQPVRSTRSSIRLHKAALGWRIRV